MSKAITPDTGCCVNCFREPNIKKFIEDEGNIGDCVYCDSKTVYIHNVENVGKFIKEGILRCYEDAVEHVGHEFAEEGDLLPTKSIKEIVLEEENFFGEALDSLTTLVDDLIDDDGINYVWKALIGPAPSDAPDEIQDWLDFCDTVKSNKRFTVFLDTEPDPTDPKKPKNLFTIIANHFSENELKYYQPGKIIYRARIKSESKTYGHEQLTSPPLSNTRNSRMSPVGISFFYGGNDSSTCIHEVRPSVGEVVVVAEFEVIRELTILTLPQNIRLSNSKYHPGYVYSYQDFFMKFLEFFISDISKPIRDTDADVEYVPAQVFTEFIKSFNFDKVFTNRGSDKNGTDPVIFDGISFPSSLKTGGQNIVLFRGPDISTEDTLNKDDAWLLYKGCTEVEITKNEVSWEPVML